jgi:hypothetical protein
MIELELPSPISVAAGAARGQGRGKKKLTKNPKPISLQFLITCRVFGRFSVRQGSSKTPLEKYRKK